MALSSGSRIGSFEIVSVLGVGGMGEVYRGRDSRLNREVAIKILPAEFSSNAERLRRFEQEARSASALNHPNIITIYEVGSTDSTAFIAMEFIDGETLRELISSGPLHARRAVQIATQIAEGLSKAHDAGIIHRDLKPENIMVTNDGYVKILDFGLAKAFLQQTNEKVSVLPTSTGTEAGVVLGTVGYMSPEQASGASVDFRSDQFSFGAILYEMVTGKRAFQKKTTVETLAAIINQEPEPIQSSVAPVPPPIRWIIDECLEKNPKDRYASTRDLARDLQNVRDHFSELTSSSELPVETRQTPPIRRRLQKVWNWLAPLLILLLAAGWFLARKPAAQVQEERQISNHRLTYRRGTIESARFTPDGQTIVYSAKWEGKPSDLFIARPDAVESRSLGIADASILSISRSGEMLLALKRGNERFVLAQAPLTGGTPREIVENIRAADWSPDGSKMAIGRYEDGKTILEFPPGHKIFETFYDIQPLRFSPDGNLIAIIEHLVNAINGKVKVIDLNGKVVLDSPEMFPSGLAWAPSGKEIWVTNLSNDPGGGMELFSMSLDGKKKFISAFPWSSLADMSADQKLLMNFTDARMMAAATHSEEEREVNLSWLDQSEVAGISADGKKVLIHERGEGSEGPSGTIYLVNADGTSGLRLAGGNPTEFSPDGKWVLATIAGRELILVPVGAGSIRSLKKYEQKQNIDAVGFLPDGRVLIDLITPQQILILNPNGGEPQKIADRFYALRRNKISPDGKSVLATSQDDQFVVLSIENGKTSLIPGLESGEEPISWSADGRSIYVYDPFVIPTKIFKIEIATGKRTQFREIQPVDPAGILALRSIAISRDEQTLAYSYNRRLSTLYTILGLQ